MRRALHIGLFIGTLIGCSAWGRADAPVAAPAQPDAIAVFR